jgi:ferritin-like metal-binding protein YciE
MKLDSLHELFVEQLQDIYDAEHQIVEALPKMVKAASDNELQAAFQEHLEQSRTHIQRLEQAFEILGETAKRKACKGMKGVIAEGAELMEEDADADVMDAGLISAAQHVEHYEIASYGTLRTYAELMGHTEVVDLLQQTLEEEKTTDQLLTDLASELNVEATQAG